MNKILKQLKKSKKIALFSHISADPDTIGSTMALCLALKAMGKEVYAFCDDENLEKFEFLDILKYYNQTENFDDFDLFVAVDIASIDRLGKYQFLFEQNNNTIRIDHHKSGEDFAKLNLMVPYGACGVLIYEIITKLKQKITPQIATLLYFAICGDTGGFRFNNTDAKIFGACEKLLNAGADIKRVYAEFFDKKSLPVLRLTSDAILNVETNDDMKFALLKIDKKKYQTFGVDESEYVGNLPNMLLNCGYKIACILKEKSDGIRVSLRSKFEYDCSLIAEKFGGGGHKNASGINFEDKTLDEVELLIKNAIIEFLDNYNDGGNDNENWYRNSSRGKTWIFWKNCTKT